MVSAVLLAEWASFEAHKYRGRWVILEAQPDRALVVVEAREDLRVIGDLVREYHAVVYVPRAFETIADEPLILRNGTIAPMPTDPTLAERLYETYRGHAQQVSGVAKPAFGELPDDVRGRFAAMAGHARHELGHTDSAKTIELERQRDEWEKAHDEAVQERKAAKDARDEALEQRDAALAEVDRLRAALEKAAAPPEDDEPVVDGDTDEAPKKRGKKS